MEARAPGDGNKRFLILNLALVDNLDIARQVFLKMIDPS
jgi:hypothetical protein